MPKLKVYKKIDSANPFASKSFQAIFAGTSVLLFLIMIVIIMRSLFLDKRDPSLKNICDLNLGRCTVRINDQQRVALSVEPTPYVANSALTFTASLYGFPYPNTMQVALTTLDPSESPINKEKPMKQVTQTDFVTKTSLPARHGENNWVVMILLKTHNKKDFAIPFTLSAEKKDDSLMDAVKK